MLNRSLFLLAIGFGNASFSVNTSTTFAPPDLVDQTSTAEPEPTTTEDPEIASQSAPYTSDDTPITAPMIWPEAESTAAPTLESVSTNSTDLTSSSSNDTFIPDLANLTESDSQVSFENSSQSLLEESTEVESVQNKTTEVPSDALWDDMNSIINESYPTRDPSTDEFLDRTFTEISFRVSEDVQGPSQGSEDGISPHEQTPTIPPPDLAISFSSAATVGVIAFTALLISVF